METRTRARRLLTAVLLWLAVAPAMGCTLLAFSTQDPDGDQVAGGPAEPVELPRYSGECAMGVTNGHVQDNTPISEPSLMVRFYVLPRGSGEATLFTAYEDEPLGGEPGAPVYGATYLAGSLQIRDDTSGMTSARLNLLAGRWNVIELHWTSGDRLALWLNSDARTELPTTTIPAGVASVDAFRLGALSPTGDVAFVYDDVDYSRISAIGTSLTVGDADADGQVTAADVTAVEMEIAGSIAPGQADCTLEGVVDHRDKECVAYEGGFGETRSLPAPDTEASGDLLGTALAVAGGRIAVGRPGAAGGAGQVIIYRFDGGVAVEEALIDVPAGRTATAFGTAVALDGNRLLVGSDGQAGGDDALHAALFEHGETGWVFRRGFRSAQANDGYGTAVALDDRWLVIGAPGDDAAAVDAGAVYLVDLDGNPEQATILRATDPVAGAGFGSAVSIHAGALAVGAPDAGSGQVLLFAAEDGSVQDQRSGLFAGDRFGAAVALDAHRLVVGVPGRAVAGVVAGTAYVHEWPGLTLQGRVDPPVPMAGARFGSSLATIPNRLAVGAPGSGAVHEFDDMLQLSASVAASEDHRDFGTAIALANEVLVVGAPLTAASKGAVSFLRDPTLLLTTGFED